MRELNAEENLLISGGYINSDGSQTYNTWDDGYSCRWAATEPGLETVGGFHAGSWEVYTMPGVLVASYTIYAAYGLYTGASNLAAGVAAQWNSVVQQASNWVANQTGVPITGP